MSRSGYSDDCDGPDLYLWMGTVKSAINGKRGQALIKDMAKALDEMPVKRLIANELVTKDGEVCALGAVARERCIDTFGVEPEDSERVASLFNISRALAKEIAFQNDQDLYFLEETPEERWKRVRKWVDDNLKKTETSGAKQ